MEMDFSYILVILFISLIFRLLIQRFQKASSINRFSQVLVRREEGPNKAELLEYIYNAMVKSKLYKSVSIS